jgi:hypothetical protein
LNLGNITDLENFVQTVSDDLYTLNTIENGGDSFTISDSSMSFVVDGSNVMTLNDGSGVIVNNDLRVNGFLSSTKHHEIDFIHNSQIEFTGDKIIVFWLCSFNIHDISNSGHGPYDSIYLNIDYNIHFARYGNNAKFGNISCQTGVAKFSSIEHIKGGGGFTGLDRRRKINFNHYPHTSQFSNGADNFISDTDPLLSWYYLNDISGEKGYIALAVKNFGKLSGDNNCRVHASITSLYRDTNTSFKTYNGNVFKEYSVSTGSNNSVDHALSSYKGINSTIFIPNISYDGTAPDISDAFNLLYPDHTPDGVSGNTNQLTQSIGDLDRNATTMISSNVEITRSKICEHALDYGDASDNVASFSHRLQDTSMNFGFAQDSSGNTIVNAPLSSTDGINLSIDNSPVINIANDRSIDISGNMDISGDVKFNDVIGINTAPDTNYKLDISGDVRVKGTLYNDTIESNSGQDLSLKRESGSKIELHTDSLRFYDSSDVNKFTIKDGNVGINKSDAGANFALDVSGNVNIDGSLNLGTINDLESFVHTVSGDLYTLNTIENGDDSFTISDNSMSFVIDAIERMKIRNSNIVINSDVSFAGTGKVVQIDGSLNLGSITDLEAYVDDISNDLANLSQNQIIESNSSITISDNSMSFVINNNDAMVLDSNSNLGIGTNPSGSYKLDVNGNIGVGSSVKSSETEFWLEQTNGTNIKLDSAAIRACFNGVNTDERFTILKTGDVGIGITDPSKQLDVSGDAAISGNLDLGSITNLENYVSEISSNLDNLSQNQIIDASSSITISDNSMSFVVDDNNAMTLSDASGLIVNDDLRVNGFLNSTKHHEIDFIHTSDITNGGLMMVFWLCEFTYNTVEQNSVNYPYDSLDLEFDYRINVERGHNNNNVYSHNYNQPHYQTGNVRFTSIKSLKNTTGAGAFVPIQSTKFIETYNESMTHNDRILTSWYYIEDNSDAQEPKGYIALALYHTVHILINNKVHVNSVIRSLHNDSHSNLKFYNGEVFHSFNPGGQIGDTDGPVEFPFTIDVTSLDQSFNYVYPDISNSKVNVNGRARKYDGPYQNNKTIISYQNINVIDVSSGSSITRANVSSHALDYGDASDNVASFSHRSQDTSLNFGFAQDSNGNTIVNAPSSSDGIKLSIDNSPVLSVADDGNVGIGVTDPSKKLEVDGDVSFSGNLIGNGSSLTNLDATQLTGTINISRIPTGSIADTVCLGDDPRLSDARQCDGTFKSDQVSNARSNLSLGSNSNVTFRTLEVGQSMTSPSFDSKTSQDLIIKNTNSNKDIIMMTSNTSERLRILSGGNVGIGLTNPGKKLEVDGDVSFSGNATINNAFVGQYDSTWSMFKHKDAATSDYALRTKDDGSTLLNASSSSSNKLSFRLDNSEKMNITSGDIRMFDNLVVSGSKPELLLDAGSSNVNRKILFHADSGHGNSYMIAGYTTRLHFLSDSYMDWTTGTTDPSNTFKKMTLLANGNLGIGTTNPGKELEVVGDISFSGNLYQNGSLFSGGGSWTTSGNDIYNSNSGNVGIGTNSPGGSYKLDVIGTVKAVNYVATSDRNLKENIESIDKETLVDNISKLNAYTFNFKSDSTKTKRIGLIAQELQEVYPELVTKSGEDSTLSVDYNGMIPVLLECIKTQQSQINEQQSQINELQKQVQNLIN